MLTELDQPTDLRVYTIAQVLAEGSMTVDEIHDVSKIDHWFLRRLERIANFSKTMEVCNMCAPLMVGEIELYVYKWRTCKVFSAASKTHHFFVN